jgi:Na+-driven multidrug efflux pump
VFIPSVYILNGLFGLDGVIYAQPVADFISIVLSLIICLGIFRKMDNERQR